MLSEHRRLMDAATMAMVLLGSGFIGFLFAPLGLGGGLLFAPLLHSGLGWEIDGALLIVSLGLSATGLGVQVFVIAKKVMSLMYGSSKVLLEHYLGQSSGLSL